MIRNKLKELHLTNSSRDTDLNHNLHPNRTIHHNDKPIPRCAKKNLPELKLSKLKSKIPSETENDINKDNQEDQKIPLIRANKSQTKYKHQQRDLIFPQISGKKLKKDIKPLINNNINTININKPKQSYPIKAKPKGKGKGDQLYALPMQSKDKDLSQDHTDLMTERLNIINSLISSFNLLSGGSTNALSSFPLLNYVKPKVTSITPAILTQVFKDFEPSKTSNGYELNSEDCIQGYGYNSHQGNVRDYNEDTVTAIKISSCHFFGVYDGHGGNACSIFLKEFLHQNIREFSVEGLKDAIALTEDMFIKTKALNSQNEIIDSSGSCGIVVCIKGSKCIIGNVGDSRCVVFKNHKVDFYTEDHKPGSDIEKERITQAGGKIYQTPSIFPLYQNGQEIEVPWRVLPGRLSVSRTFGDVEAKEEHLGGMKNVVVALPDVTTIDLTNEYDFIVLGCDGIFDVLSNEELIECIDIVMKEKKESDIHEICGYAADMIIKASLAKDSFDNVSCVVIALNMN